jgi:N-acetylneuraminic acid mutarotase
LIAARTLPAFFQGDVPGKFSRQTLSFAERVAYQRAIEDVYWRHRIWPKERPDPKPSLDAVMSQAQLENKVTDYLCKSQALEDYWHRPITTEQLQGEMDRMAKHTKRPDVLQEIFDAMGNEPFVIAECLARPVLSERLVTNFYAHDQRFHGKLKSRTESWGPGAAYQMFDVIGATSASYILSTISDGPNGCIDDTWAVTDANNAPTARYLHPAVWTGNEMIIWGGTADLFTGLNTGARYNPTTDSWASTSMNNAPAGRYDHSAVWTGNEMIVWGGTDMFNYHNSGGRYNPSTDSWVATNTTNAPTERDNHTAVWTGNEMIVWGGLGAAGTLNTGGRYNASTDNWTATNTTNAPASRETHTAVWTGNEMVIWGGFDGSSTYFNTGGKYNPDTNSWTPTSTTNVPDSRSVHTAVWTGNEMIVWGGVNFNTATYFNTGGRYNPATNNWTVTSTVNVPDGRFAHTAFWTGSEMIIWGGFDIVTYFNTGGRYDPGTDTWLATSTTNAPAGRYYHTGVWTDSQMIVWGGDNNTGTLNTGGGYCAQSAPTPTPTPCAGRCTPTPRPRPSPAPRP